MFSTGGGPANVCAWNAEQRDYSRKLYYWKTTDPAPKSDVAGLLKAANGNCDAWVRLFRDALLVNQVTVNRIKVLPWNHVPGEEHKFRLVVREVLWDEEDPAYPDDAPWQYEYKDIDQSPAGLPGQNTGTPAQKVFWWHWLGERRVIVQDEVTLTYYDPSYGITADDEADFTNKAIAGWGKRMEGAMHYAKVSEPRPAEEKVKFDPTPWP